MYKNKTRIKRTEKTLFLKLFKEMNIQGVKNIAKVGIAILHSQFSIIKVTETAAIKIIKNLDIEKK